MAELLVSEDRWPRIGHRFSQSRAYSSCACHRRAVRSAIQGVMCRTRRHHDAPRVADGRRLRARRPTPGEEPPRHHRQVSPRSSTTSITTTARRGSGRGGGCRGGRRDDRRKPRGLHASGARAAGPQERAQGVKALGEFWPWLGITAAFAVIAGADAAARRRKEPDVSHCTWEVPEAKARSSRALARHQAPAPARSEGEAREPARGDPFGARAPKGSPREREGTMPGGSAVALGRAPDIGRGSVERAGRARPRRSPRHY